MIYDKMSICQKDQIDSIGIAKKCMALGAEYFFDKATEFEKVTEVIENLTQDAQT